MDFTCRIPDCDGGGRVIGERTEKSMRVAPTFGSPKRTSPRVFSPYDTPLCTLFLAPLLSAKAGRVLCVDGTPFLTRRLDSA